MILPFLFEIERTKLSRKHEEILLSLTTKEAAKKAQSVDELYALLPDEIRTQVNRLDFLDFVEAIELTGHAARSGEDRLLLSPAGKPKLRIKIH